VKLEAALATAPATGYSNWVNSGNIDLSGYSGTIFIGFRYDATTDANYATWCVDDVVIGEPGDDNGGSGDDGGEGGEVVTGTEADFESLNGGEATGYYGTYTTAQGWSAANCSVLQGGDADNNPTFKCFGYKSEGKPYFAACMNGKTTAVGTITSPVIGGGIAKLNFKYAIPFSETKGVKFKVEILQGGSVVKSFTVDKSDAAKLTAYDYSVDVNVDGEFQIVFTNLSPSAASDKNKDRYAIWNVNWTQK
jgi:hypothetical protein